jgi:hypothetical protein
METTERTENDDTREFCEECGRVIEAGQPANRCGLVAWHAARGVACVDCAAERAVA